MRGRSYRPGDIRRGGPNEGTVVASPARTRHAPTVCLCINQNLAAEMEWLIYAQPYTPVLAEERRNRCVDLDLRAAGDAGARAPGELHLLLAAITERRIDRSCAAPLLQPGRGRLQLA